MTTYDYENAYVSLKWLASHAANLTNDQRGLNSHTKYIYAALLKLKNYDQDDHSVLMSVIERDDIVGCLRMVHWVASQSEYNSMALTAEALNLLDTLNILFKKEGLAPVTELYKK